MWKKLTFTISVQAVAKLRQLTVKKNKQTKKKQYIDQCLGELILHWLV